jgi:PGF-pre-PGF domain-containing protein
LNKGLIGKISIFSLILLTFIIALIFNINPVSSEVNPGDLRPLYGNSICDGNPCPAWVNLTRGDMFFADGNDVYIIVNISCTSPHACNVSTLIDANFSQVGGNQLRAGVFKQNGTNASWAIFEFNGTVNFSAISGSITMSPKNITFNASVINETSGSYNTIDMPGMIATVLLVNMSTPPGCPPAGESVQLPPAVPLLNGTIVSVINACWTNCTVDDRAQQYNSSHYVLCGPTFGGSSTNFTDVAANGNFSNFSFVIDIPGKVKINFTQNVSMDTQQKSQSLFDFAMKNMMSGGRIGINESQYNGTDTTKPNLTLSAALTLYNFSGRFGLTGNRRPSIARSATYGSGSFSPCPASVCSGITWDGQNITFSVTGFSEYSIERGLSVVLSNNTTGTNFNSTLNISYTNTRNVNFSYIPIWNSTVAPQTVTLWGNFTGTWTANVTNTTALVNASINYINRTVDSDGPYLWNIVINDTTGGNDTHVANWTIIVDTTSPTWFTNQTNVSLTPNYSSTNYSQFNITWNDTNGSISTVFLEINLSTPANFTMSNSTYGGSIYSRSIVLPAGTYYWKSYANDSLNNWNTSANWTFTIGNGTNPVYLYLNNSTNQNNTYYYPQTINATATSTAGTVFLYRNNSYLVNGTIWTTNESTYILLGNNTYPFKANATGNANYSDNTTGVTYYAIVNKGPTNVSLYLNTTQGNVTYSPYVFANLTAKVNVSTLTVNISTNITGWNWTEPTNTSEVYNITNISLGGLNITAYTLGNANYSESSTTYFATVALLTNGASCTIASQCSGSYCVHLICRGSSIYCGDGYCDSGETTVSCSLDCGTSSGGPGGSSNPPSSTKVTVTRGNANITVPSIAASNMANVSITKTEDVAFRQINISVANSVNNIKIAITKLAGSPASVSHTIDGNVYHYISIDKTNFTDTDINKVFIKFAVNKTWSTDNDLSTSNVSLYRWENNKWNELVTTYLSEDASEAFYQAESSGLSYFLIGTKGGEITVTPTCTENWSCTDWSICVAGTQTRTCTDVNVCGTTINKPVESQTCEVKKEEVKPAEISWLYYSIATVVIIALAVILFIFRKKITPAFSKSSKKKQFK